MISCKEYQQALLGKENEEIQEPLASQVAEHLERCPLCLAEAESFLPLIDEIRDLPELNPGELFFRKQLKNIEKQIASEHYPSRSRTYRPWYASLVAAAAVLLLFVSYHRWGQHQDEPWKKDWKNALNFLAEDSEPDLLAPELEELSDLELDQVAQILVKNMFEDFETKNKSKSDDWMDLNGEEMNSLLHRLETEKGRKAS